MPLWKRLDAEVLQWIYATVSHEILTSVLVVDDVAEKAWKRVAQIFQENKNTRPTYLEIEFTTTKMVEFSSVMAYNNWLKYLAVQLANVGSPVTDQRMVLRLLAGLPESYAHFVITIQQKDVLPSFIDVCSRLKLEELRKKEPATRAPPLLWLMMIPHRRHHRTILEVTVQLKIIIIIVI